MSFPPADIDEAERPAILYAPEVAVTFNAPVETVNPFEAVSS
jgi:hypothetical protein